MTESLVPDFDVVVIGAGFTGMYQLYKLRQLGYSVKGVEAGSDIGGVWHWNRYPGCRVDSESIAYAYFWSETLRREFVWTEQFAGQPEVLRYLDRAEKEMDVRKDYMFDSRVSGLNWNEEGCYWEIEIAGKGYALPMTARFVVAAVGPLSAPQWPKFPGIHSFRGETYHTAMWPRDEYGFGGKAIDFTGKRVGVVGTGSSGVQVIQTIGPVVNHLTVFQRTPNWCMPLKNRPLTSGERANQLENWKDIAALCENSITGFPHTNVPRNAMDATPEEREAFWEHQYAQSGYTFWLSNYQDIWTDPRAMGLVSEFVARKIRDRINDPAIAEKLIPKDHGFGTRRVPMEKNYFEVYNQDNVALVDLTDTPIKRVTRTGIRTNQADHELDVIIYATGFDAITGSFTRLNVTGCDGRSLNAEWENDLHTYLGLTSNGFPNFFTLVGPHNGATFCNVPRCSAIQVEWIARLFSHMKDNGFSRVESRAESDREWTNLVNVTMEPMLLNKTRSWFTGTNQNIAGREDSTRVLIWAGGNPAYREHCDSVAEHGFRGYVFA